MVVTALLYVLGWGLPGTHSCPNSQRNAWDMSMCSGELLPDGLSPSNYALSALASCHIIPRARGSPVKAHESPMHLCVALAFNLDCFVMCQWASNLPRLGNLLNLLFSLFIFFQVGKRFELEVR